MDRWGITPDRVGGRHRGVLRPASADTAPVRPFLSTARESHRGFSEHFGADGDGFSMAGRGECGLHAHRGALHSDEYVDLEDLKARVSERLGFTLDEVASVYRQGPLSPAGRALRARIDARLLEVAEAGGLVVELGRALGWAVRDDEGDCQTLKNALARAKSVSESA